MNTKWIGLIGLLFVGVSCSTMQPRGEASDDAATVNKTENVILITTDGLRWQEVFTGADPNLLNLEQGGIKELDPLREAFWRDSAEARREALLPFFWSVIAKEGQLFGNQLKGSVVRVTNGRNFSYPGYQEILTGFPDDRIDSNDKLANPNRSVLEWLNAQPDFSGRVAAFCAWDVFPYILNEERSKIPVSAGWNPIKSENPSPREQVLNDLLTETTPYWDSVTYDSFVFEAAMEHLRRDKPRVLYVAFGETDDWAHDGRYDLVLRAAHGMDHFVRRLWEAAQSMPEYRNKTSLVIGVDHGRGTGSRDWRSHNADIPGSENTWLAAMGPGIPALGERSKTEPIGMNQIAATVAALLGKDYNAAEPKAGPVIQTKE